MNKISQEGDKYILRFDSGTEVIEGLERFCREHDIKGAWFTGLGSSQEAVVAFFDLPAKEYKDHTFNERLEVAGLTGNIASAGGKLFVHAHGVFADSTLSARAGHVKKLVVGATCEVRLEAIPGGLNRKPDEKTGLNLLD